MWTWDNQFEISSQSVSWSRSWRQHGVSDTEEAPVVSGQCACYWVQAGSQHRSAPEWAPPRQCSFTILYGKVQNSKLISGLFPHFPVCCFQTVADCRWQKPWEVKSQARGYCARTLPRPDLLPTSAQSLLWQRWQRPAAPLLHCTLHPTPGCWEENGSSSAKLGWK